MKACLQFAGMATVVAVVLSVFVITQTTEAATWGSVKSRSGAGKRGAAPTAPSMPRKPKGKG
jgi:hypothetical protein